jgi:hypothetical protein
MTAAIYKHPREGISPNTDPPRDLDRYNSTWSASHYCIGRDHGDSGLRPIVATVVRTAMLFMANLIHCDAGIAARLAFGAMRSFGLG